MERWILHVDMDAFFAAVERLDDPSLIGRPVIVGGLGARGVVSTASYEARAYGVRSAQPMAQARRLCPEGVFLPPRHDRYEEVSRQIRAHLERHSPWVEPLSLDEAYVDLSNVDAPEQVATAVHRELPREVGISCSVGLACNKLLAKLASEAAKPAGLRIMRTEDVDDFLRSLPVERLWGVGPKTAQRLYERGVRTVGDLQTVDPGVLRTWFGPRQGAQLWRLSRGQDDSLVMPVREARSLSQEITFPEDVYDPELLVEELRRLADLVSARLSDEEMLARAVRMKVRWSDFTTQSRQIRLVEPTDDPQVVRDEVVALWDRRLPDEGKGVRLLGVGVEGLLPATFRPLSLFGMQRSGPASARMNPVDADGR